MKLLSVSHLLLLLACVSCAFAGLLSGIFNGFGQEYGRGLIGFDRNTGRGQSQSQGRQEYGPIGRFGKLVGGLITGRRN